MKVFNKILLSVATVVCLGVVISFFGGSLQQESVSIAQENPERALEIQQSEPIAEQAPLSANQQGAPLDDAAEASFVAFERWLNAEPGADVQAWEQQGLRLAKTRQVVMKQLIKSNPRKALDNAVSFTEYAQLPASLKPFIEKPFSQRSDLLILPHEEGVGGIGKFDPKAFSRNSVYLQSANGETSETLDVYRYGSRNAINSKDGIATQGVTLGGLAALRDAALFIVPATDRDYVEANYPVAKSGVKTDFLTGKQIIEEPVLALAGGVRFYFSSVANAERLNFKLSELEQKNHPKVGSQVLFTLAAGGVTSESGVESAIAQALVLANTWTESAKKVFFIRLDFSDKPGESITKDALKTALNSPVSSLIQDMSGGKSRIDAEVSDQVVRLPSVSTAYAPSNSVSLYSDAITAFNQLNTGVNLDDYDIVGVHFGAIGMKYAGLASVGGSQHWLHDTSSTYVITHEFGHNYGLLHGNFWDTSNNSVTGTGANEEYGDKYDIMGRNYDARGHFHPQAQAKLNWLETSDWTEVTTSGKHRVHRFDHENASGNRALKIPRSGDGDYWVGFRQLFTENNWLQDGIYLIWQRAGQTASWLVDTTPGSFADGNEDKNDAGVVVGRTYSDTTANVHITPLAKGGVAPNEWIDVQVNVGSFDGNQAPTVTMSNDKDMFLARDEVVFTAVANDPDGDVLAYSWDFGDNVVHTNSNSVTRQWLVGGSYTVKVTVSDMKGKTASAEQAVTVNEPLSANLWTKRVSGVNNDLYDIATDGSKVVVAAYQSMLQSTDGVTWSKASTSINAYLYGVTYSGENWVAVGQDYSGGWLGAVYTSSDGNTWSRRYLSGAILRKVVAHNGVLIAVGDGGTILRSADHGLTWAAVTSGTTSQLRDVAYGDGVFAAVGFSGSSSSSSNGGVAVVTSSDGSTWVDRSSGAGVDISSGVDLRHIEYLKDRFVASGWYSKIRYSTDSGVSFATKQSGVEITPANAYGNGVFLSAGIDKDKANLNVDINLVSIDGESWQPIAANEQANRNAAIFFKNTFITVGKSGSIYQSALIPAPTPADVVVSETNVNVGENGSTATFSVRLAMQPESSVILKVVSSDVSEASVSPATLTFTNANWNQEQVVTVTGVDDPLVDGLQNSSVTVSVDAANSDVAYSGVVAKMVAVSTVDNETAGLLVSKTSLSVNESGSTDSLTVQLTAQPTSDVVLTVSSSDTGEATVSPTTLTFTNANWNAAQTVTATGVDDQLVDGEQSATLTVAINAASSDAAYSAVAAQTATISVADNDTAGLQVSRTSLSVNESGSTDSLTVQLTAQPSSDVVLTVSSSDTGEATVSPTTLTFTNANWNTAQTVTATGVDDQLVDGEQSATLTVAINTASSDAAYSAVAAQTATISVADNDTAGLQVSRTALSVNESGSTDSLTVQLTAQPTSDVVLTVSSSDTGEATVSPTTLTFTNANWNAAQTVTATGVDDQLVDGEQSATLTVAINTASSDAAYSAVAAQTATISVADNDTAGLQVSRTALSVNESGSTDSLTVQLTAQPSSDVVLTVSSSDTGEATVSPTTLTFTNANWNTAQTVTATGVDDQLVDGEQSATLTVAINTASSDSAYSAVAAQTATISVADNDTAGLQVSRTALSVNESGSTDSLTVQLTAQPTSDVVLTVSSSDTGEATVSPTTLTFTNANWNTAQTVTATGVDDQLVDGEQSATLTVAINTASSDAAYSAVAAQTATISVADNDTAGLQVSRTALSVNESGSTDSLTVQLTAQPTSDVVLTVSSSDTGEATVSPTTLTFTNANWNTAQTVTATGVDDQLVDGEQSATLTVAVNAASSDAAYSAVAAQTATISVADNDVEADTAPPIVTAPSNVKLESKRYRTQFDLSLLGAATAQDVIDGAVDASLELVDGVAPVYRNNKTRVLLVPGRHTFTWSATDAAGNKGSAVQQVDVLPKASFVTNQSGSEGQSLDVTVVLNGDAPDYPVIVPFSLGGTAQRGSDLDYTLSSAVSVIQIEKPAEEGVKPSGVVSVTLREDAVDEIKETILFTLDEATGLTNAIPGAKRVHRIKILAQNVAPRVRKMRVEQTVNGASRKGRRIYQNDGVATVTAVGKDPNGDVLTYSWSSNTLTDLDSSNDTFEFDPTQVSRGRHSVTVTVSDGVLSTSRRKTVRIKTGSFTPPASLTLDTDGDGILDKDEPNDENENGIADWLEDINVAASELPTEGDNPIVTEPGLTFSLGDFSGDADDAQDAEIKVDQLRSYLESEGKVYQADTGFETPSLILDYTIGGIEIDESGVGQSVPVIISTAVALPVNTKLRKYHIEKGWQAFTEDDHNKVESLIASDGNCPNDEGAVYQAGLLTGATCIRITIQDGGANDADGVVNGVIEDPVGTSVESSSNTGSGSGSDGSSTTTSTEGGSSSGGGGALPLWVLLGLVLLFCVGAFYRRQSIRLR